jgi:rubrerythrin
MITKDEVIEKAIKGEEESIKFYKNAYNLIKDKQSKIILKELESEEYNHIKTLKDFKNKKFEPENFEIENNFFDDKTINISLSETSNAQDVLTMGIKKETSSAKFYEYFANKTKDKELKKVFSCLQEEENNHKLKIEKEYERMFLLEM